MENGGATMVVAALKTLTWATVATAVVSALLLAYAGGTMPRIASLVGDATRARPALAASEADRGTGARHASPVR